MVNYALNPNLYIMTIKSLAKFAVVVAIGTAGTNVQAQSVKQSAKVGKGIYELVYSEKANAVFVTSVGTKAIYKLDPKTLAITDSISVEAAPAFGIGLNDKTQTLYTTNTRTNSVSAIDIKTKKVLNTIAAPGGKAHTREVVVDEDLNKIYITDVGGGSKIWVIDGKTNALDRVIENTGKSTTGIVLDKKAQKLYVTNMGSNQIGIVDIKQNKLVDSIPTGGEGSTNLAFDAKNNRLFVANQKSADVTVVDLNTRKVLQSIKTGAGALGITFDAAKNKVFVANRQAGTVTVIDANNFKVLADLKTGTYPNTIVVDKKSGNAYVTNKAQSKRDDPKFVDNNGDTVSLIGL
ncbi:MAG: YncE family protein [Pedobacter sp.]|nr:MAG: YncE family protein [Pedobacter sp.]